MEKYNLSVKKVVKKFTKKSKIKAPSEFSNIYQFVFSCNPYVQMNYLNYSPFSSLYLEENTRAKTKEIRNIQQLLFFTVWLNEGGREV